MKKISELMSLRGRRALITGATGGLGKYISKAIAELGGNLILVDKPGSNYENILNELKENELIDIKVIDCDLEIEEDRTNLIFEINDKYFNDLDVLINNAAFGGSTELSGWITKFEDQSTLTWRRALEVNLTAAFDLSKAFSSILGRNQNGSIINIASIYGFAGPVMSMYEGTDMGNPAAYAASKGGLIQLTRWLAINMAPNVRVNAVSPGGIWRNQPNEFVEKYVAKTPLQRMATEEDFQGIIAYLSTDLSLYMTGQNIIIDGGWTL